MIILMVILIQVLFGEDAVVNAHFGWQLVNNYLPIAIQVTSLVPVLSFAYTDIVKLLVVKLVMPQLGTALPTLDVFVPTQANT